MGVQSDADLPGPAERAAKAVQRIQELQQRRVELAAGAGVSTATVVVARQRAEQALQRAQLAHEAASQSHEQAAEAHERAANTLQRATLLTHDDSESAQQRADAHWHAAQENHEAADGDLAEADDPAQSSSGTA